MEIPRIEAGPRRVRRVATASPGDNRGQELPCYCEPPRDERRRAGSIQCRGGLGPRPVHRKDRTSVDDENHLI